MSICDKTNHAEEKQICGTVLETTGGFIHKDTMTKIPINISDISVNESIYYEEDQFISEPWVFS